MPPAARLGDLTAHGKPLAGGTGSPTVLIGGKPAWRIGLDIHVCPLIDPGPNPHVGGVTVGGCSTVLVNGSPVAILGDIITEASVSNAIVSGEPTVMVCNG